MEEREKVDVSLYRRVALVQTRRVEHVPTADGSALGRGLKGREREM